MGRWMHDRRPSRITARVLGSLAGALLICLAPPPAAAQVGYPPDASPYRDIARGRGPVVHAGYIVGGRGIVDVGITNIKVAGVRFELPLASVFRVSVGASYAQGERYVIDPASPPGQRRSGPESDQLYLLDAEILMSLTGQKTWNSLAPYVLAGGGVAFGGAEPDTDESAYRFGIKTYLAPGAGLRWYLSPGVNVRADFRVIVWRLRYPSQFYGSSQGQPPVLAAEQADLEWTRHPAVRISVGWNF